MGIRLSAPAGRINLGDVKRESHHNLRDAIVGDCGQPLRDDRWACPIHGGDGPNLGITPDGQRYRCFVCNETGDIFQWLNDVRGMGLMEAVEFLGGKSSTNQRLRAPVKKVEIRKPSAVKLDAWLDPDWQCEVDRIVREAEAVLWSPAGREAFDWLLARGLTDTTIRRFRLGFQPEPAWSKPLNVLIKDGRARKLWTPRCITIPLIAPSQGYRTSPDDAVAGHRWVGCKLRRLADRVRDPLPPDIGEKYISLAGTATGYPYPHGEFLPTQGNPPALIVEGEFDALVAEQEAGHMVYVTTSGGATIPPKREALSALACCPWWLVATDHDKRGNDAFLRWRERAPHKAHRITTMLPDGTEPKDLTDFVVAGGDVQAWLHSEGERIMREMRS